MTELDALDAFELRVLAVRVRGFSGEDVQTELQGLIKEALADRHPYHLAFAQCSKDMLERDNIFAWTPNRS